MANTVKFEVTADVANAVNAVLKIVGATDKVESGFTKAASASERANRRMQSAAKATVGRIRGYTGSDQLVGESWNVQLARNTTARVIQQKRLLTRSAGWQRDMIYNASRAQRELREMREANDAQRQKREGVEEQIRFNNFSNKASKIVSGRENLKRAGLMAGGAALAAGAYAARESMQSMSEGRQRNLEFTDDFRKIATLGDNIDDIAGKRNQVLAFSNAWGVASEKITAAMYAIESAASNLSKGEKGEILTGAMQFNRMQGADPELSGKAILKYKEIWGTSVTEAKNRIFKTADLGDLDIDKMATFGPDLWAKAQAGGFTKDAADAATIAATAKLGRTEKVMTGVGDVLQKVPRVGKKLGLNLHRDLSFLDQLEPYTSTRTGMDKLAGEDMFGTDIGVVQALVQSRKEMKGHEAALGAAGRGDPVADKLKKMWTDPAMKFAEKTAIFGQLDRNGPLTKDYVEKHGGTDLDFQARQEGARQKLPQYLSWLREPAAWGETAVQEADKTKLGWAGGVLREAIPLTRFRDLGKWLSGPQNFPGKGSKRSLLGALNPLLPFYDTSPGSGFGVSDPLKDAGNASAFSEMAKAGRTDLLRGAILDKKKEFLSDGILSADEQKQLSTMARTAGATESAAAKKDPAGDVQLQAAQLNLQAATIFAEAVRGGPQRRRNDHN